MRPHEPVPQPSATALQRRSVPVLRWLSRRRWVLPTVTAVLLLAGLSAPRPVGPVLLVLLVVLLAWLSGLSWPVLSPAGRVLRGVVLALLVATVTLRSLG